MPIAAVPLTMVTPPWKILLPVKEQHAAAITAAVHDGDAARRAASRVGTEGGINLQCIAIGVYVGPACAKPR